MHDVMRLACLLALACGLLCDAANAADAGVCSDLRRRDHTVIVDHAAGHYDGERAMDEASIRALIKRHSAQTRKPFFGLIPRVTAEELEQPGFEAYKARRRPFILTGAMGGWQALARWPIDRDAPPLGSYLAQKFPAEVSDYYPHNMDRPGQHPYLARFNFGLSHLLNPEHENRFGYPLENQPGRYLHLQLTPRRWRELERAGDLPTAKSGHKHLTAAQDNWWMRRCLRTDAHPGDTLAEEYHLKTHWKIILIGSEGAGMFNHSDSLQTSSWHAHVQGKKWWYVCGRNEGPGPRANERVCMEAVVYPGESLYYGRHWHHHTQNLETPTMTVTGTVVHAGVFDSVARQLHGECTGRASDFMFSAALCDALQSCYPLWYKRWRPRQATDANMARLFPPWRSVAKADRIKEKEARRPEENNYDGRNYISGFEQDFELD